MFENFSLSHFFSFCAECLEGRYGPFIQISGIFLFVFVFNFAIKKILEKLRNYFTARHKVWSLTFVSTLQKPLFYFTWFVALACSIDTLLSGLLSYHLQNLHLILSVGAVLFFSWFLFQWNANIVEHMKELSYNHQLALTPFNLDLISKLATIAIIFVTLFLLLDVTGRSMQTLIAFGGIGGLALAFASQQVISNFFGGLMVYLTRPFTIGEWVIIPDKKIEGHIEEIGWYLTRIRNFEKRPIYVPNSVFTQTIVITPSRMSHERFHHIIGLRYQDIHTIKPIIDRIKAAFSQHISIDSHLPIEVFFTNFGPSTLDIEISAYVKTGNSFREVRQELLLAIGSIILQEGAEIATPTQIVEIQNGNLSKIPLKI